jgi:mono/diheme cytochrome c family protein
MKKRYYFSSISMVLILGALPSFAGSAKGDLKRGKAVFQNMQCAICHTDGGNNLNPERPLKGESFLKRYPANDNNKLEQIIRQGIKDKGMPAFGKDKMSDQDMADVIVYIRSFTPLTAGKTK